MPAAPIVAITFDDGPSIYTSRILDTLQQHGGRVSFFVMGSKVEEHKSKINRAVLMDCEIICHAWDHLKLDEQSRRIIKKQLVNTIKAIAKITGKVSLTFRPPYGQTNEKVIKIAEKLGLAIVNWTLDPQDWDRQIVNAGAIYSYIMKNVKDGDIILCHDTGEATSTAMSRVIPDLIARKYRLVTVTELLKEKYGVIEPGKIYPLNNQNEQEKTQ